MIFLGLLLAAVGIAKRGWALLALWPGVDFLLYGIAHLRRRAGIFGKQPDGTVPFWSWLLFFPLLAYAQAVWRCGRLFGREPAWNMVNEQLAIGRRIVPDELPGAFENYVDLTAEFPEPAAIRELPGYFNFPILDAGAPTPQELAEAVRRLRPGKTFVHCAQGRGRTGLFALAFLLTSRAVDNVEDGLRVLKAARSGVHLNREQRRCIEEYARILDHVD